MDRQPGRLRMQDIESNFAEGAYSITYAEWTAEHCSTDVSRDERIVNMPEERGERRQNPSH